ncbi:MAG: hypothetical protein RLZZ617_1417, partial [Bacteroidota bacterium]
GLGLLCLVPLRTFVMGMVLDGRGLQQSASQNLASAGASQLRCFPQAHGVVFVGDGLDAVDTLLENDITLRDSLRR